MLPERSGYILQMNVFFHCVVKCGVATPNVQVKVSIVSAKALFLTPVTGDQLVSSVVCKNLLAEPVLQCLLNGRPTGLVRWMKIGKDLQHFAFQSESNLSPLLTMR